MVRPQNEQEQRMEHVQIRGTSLHGWNPVPSLSTCSKRPVDPGILLSTKSMEGHLGMGLPRWDEGSDSVSGRITHSAGKGTRERHTQDSRSEGGEEQTEAETGARRRSRSRSRTRDPDTQGLASGRPIART